MARDATSTRGETVTALRGHAGLGAAELAERVGVPAERVEAWEAGRVEPTRDELAAVTRVCFERARASGAERDYYIERRLAMTPAERIADAQRLADELYEFRRRVYDATRR